MYIQMCISLNTVAVKRAVNTFGCNSIVAGVLSRPAESTLQHLVVSLWNCNYGRGR